MIPAEAFIALEGLLAKHLQTELDKSLSDLLREVSALVTNGKYEEAVQKIQILNLDSVYESSKDMIERQTAMAMMFGASRVSHTPGTTVVGLGFEQEMITQASLNFRQHLTLAAEAMREHAMQLIAQAREEGPGEPPVALDPYVEVAEVQKAERRILRDFASFMDQSGKAQMNLISSLHTSRVSAYGFTAEANVLGLTEYQISEQLDNRTCPVCQRMHGKKFKVADARRLLTVVLRTTDPAQLKSLQPWPSRSEESLKELDSLDEAELVARGWHIPPFHPRCRGLLVRVGRAPDLTLSEAPMAEAPQVTKADFDLLGIRITEAQATSWGKKFPVPPAEVLSALTGKTSEQVSLVSMVEGLSKAGVSKAKVTTKGAEFSAPKGGVSATMKVKYVPKALEVSYPELNKGVTGPGLDFLKSMYLIAKDAGYAKLETSVVGVGAYSWARAGFRVTDKDWKALRPALYARYATLEKEISEDAKQAIEAVLSGDSGTGLYGLASLGLDQSMVNIGKEMLTGLKWFGFLDLNDPVAVAAFLNL